MLGLVNFENKSSFHPDYSNQYFIEFNGLLDHFHKDFEEFKGTGHVKKDTELLVKNELTYFINDFTGKILNEPNELKAKKSIDALVDAFSHYYLNVGPLAGRKISELLDKTDLSSWGIDSDLNSAQADVCVDAHKEEQKSNQKENHKNNLKNGEISLSERLNLVFTGIFKHYNLDPKLMFAAWRESVIPNDQDKYQKENGLAIERQRELIMSNLATVAQLEAQRPGAAATLLKNFNIVNFGRYPVHLLCAQYDNMDNKELPYGLVLDAWQDYNGSSYSRGQMLDELNSDLNGKYLLRFMEAGGRFDVVRDLLSLENRYGEKQKISFAVCYGHGNEDTMSFGDWSKGRRGSDIKSSDLPEAEWLGKVRDYFSTDSTIILDSCMTGKKGGLAQDVASKFKIMVLACDRVSGGVNSIKVNEKDGVLDFKVKFLAERPYLLNKINSSMTERNAKEYKP